jgi:purine-binding chemotaxis protein CheW
MNSAEQRAHEIANADVSVRSRDQQDQFLTFIMAGEEYGVDILQVQEIRGWENVTPIPNAPAHIKGVINLRGTIVPIVDLRQRFGLQRAEYGPLTVVIVLKVATRKGSRVMGIVVDAVSDVYSLSADDMKEAPDLGDNVNTSYIRGLVNVASKMVILLDINELLGADTIPEVSVSALQELKNRSDQN